MEIWYSNAPDPNLCFTCGKASLPYGAAIWDYYWPTRYDHFTCDAATEKGLIGTASHHGASNAGQTFFMNWVVPELSPGTYNIHILVGYSAECLNATHYTLQIKIEEKPPIDCETPGYWKNHPDEWPVDTITIGWVTYTKDEAINIMKKANSKDVTNQLAAHLIAAKLNVVNGAEHGCIDETIDAADEFLKAYPVGSDPKGEEREYALSLKNALNEYNNHGCP